MVKAKRAAKRLAIISSTSNFQFNFREKKLLGKTTEKEGILKRGNPLKKGLHPREVFLIGKGKSQEVLGVKPMDK